MMEVIEISDGESSSSGELFPVEQVIPQALQPNFIFQTVYSGILQAVSRKDLKKVEEMVQRGSSVNINDNGGNTPLHLAVANNASEIMDFLLEQDDIVVNSRNFSGATPLLCAVEQGKELLVKKLLAAGASANLTNLLEVSPLHLAVENPDIAHVLILNGANLDSADYGGETPLHEAVEHNNLETICMLLYFNADANVKCHNGLTPFIKAITQGKEDAQRILLDYVDDFNVVVDDGMSMLSLALQHNSPCKVDLIARGADVNYRHPHCNAFEMICQCPSEKDFSLIWNDLEYQELAPGRDFWLNICALDKTLEYPVFLGIVVESGNLKPFLGRSSMIPSFKFLFLILNFDPSVWEDTLIKLIFIFLSEGAILTSEHLNEIYHTFGYCKLFEMLLFQDFQLLPLSEIAFPNLIYDCRLTVKQHLNVQITNFSNNGEMKAKRHILEYSKYVNSNFFLVGNNQWSVQHIPSLLEMARNRAREHIMDRFNLKTSCKFYTYLKHLPMQQVYKDILSFKKPIYDASASCSFFKYI